MEEMKEFFTSRVDEYDEHMLNLVEGCRQAYKEMAGLVPKSCKKLLDLGCGTGLELEEIFKLLPDLEVTGIDLTDAMLEKLSEKFPDKNINLICGSYFDEDLGQNKYDCAVSFQTMHHFSKEKKSGLYKRIWDSLKSGGTYIECDYMIENQDEEDFYFSEIARIRKEEGLSEDEFYHYDTPCTIQNQIKLFEKAGFSNIQKVFRVENTTIITAKKK